MSNQIQIKSEVFHSFFYLKFGVKPVVFKLNEQDDIAEINKIFNIINAYPYTPFIIETYAQKIQDTLNIYKNINTRFPIYAINYNAVHININKLNNLEKEDLDYIIKYVQDYEQGLYIFKIASNKSDTSLENILSEKINENATKLNNIENTLNTVVTTTLQEQIDNKYRSYQRTLESANTLFIEYKELLKEQCYRLQQKTTIFTDLINICKRNRLIKLTHIFENNQRIHIYTSPLRVEFTCGEEAANRIIFNNRSLETANQQIKKMLYDAITTRNKYTLLHNPIKIQIDLSGNEINRWEISHFFYSIKSNIGAWSRNILPESNVHYFKYNCFGGFTQDLNNAVNTNDITRLISNLIQYISTINIADGAGLQWITNPMHIIEDKEENKIYHINALDNTIKDITTDYNFAINLEYNDIKAKIFSNGGCYITHENKL